MITDNNDPFGGVIHTYTRKQAINDGVLVDLSNHAAVRQHWRYPLAVTDTLWQTIESVMRQGNGQAIDGILHYISTMAKLQIRGANTSDEVLFDVKLGKETHKLKLHLGSGDTPDPVLTLMFSAED